MSTHDLSTVTAAMALRLVLPAGDSLEVSAILRYEREDPYAVHVAFHTGPAADGAEPGADRLGNVGADPAADVVQGAGDEAVGGEAVGDDVVEWTFARQLLTDGVTRAVGEGDVQVWPSGVGGDQVVCLSLSSPSGAALFEAPLGELVQFLTRTYVAVPTGSESDHLDIDAELALLLWSERRD